MDTISSGLSDVCLLVIILGCCLPVLYTTPLDINLGKASMNYETADGYCKSHGLGFTLPDVTYIEDQQEITNAMATNSLLSVWLPYRRHKYNSWKWTDGQNASSYLISVSVGTDDGACASIDMPKSRLEGRRCSTNGLGFICEKLDCPSCHSEGLSGHSCKHEGTSCYIYFCGAANWYDARARCRRLGVELAVLKDRHIALRLRTMWKMRRVHQCERAWIGLHKEEWLTTAGASTVLTDIRWPRGQPRTSGDCVKLTTPDLKEYIWQTTDCNEKMSVICAKARAPTPAPTVERDACYRNWDFVASLSVGIFVTLGFMWCISSFFRRWRSARSAAREV